MSGWQERMLEKRMKTALRSFPERAAVSAAAALVLAIAALWAAHRRPEPAILLRLSSEPEAPSARGSELVACVSPPSAAFGLDGSAVRLAADCSLRFGCVTGGGGCLPLEIVARGTPVRERWPVLTVSVDGDPVADVTIGSSRWGIYRITSAIPPGRHVVGLAFANDAMRYPEDRNADILSLRLGGGSSPDDPAWRWRTPALMAPEKMAFQKFGEFRDRVYRIWLGGSVADDFVCDLSGNYHVKVRAKAAGGRARRVVVRIDGKTVMDRDVDHRGYSVYGSAVNLEQGRHFVELENAAGLSEKVFGVGIRSQQTDLLLDGILVAPPGHSFVLRRGPLNMPAAGRSAAATEFDYAWELFRTADGRWHFRPGGYGRLWITCGRPGRWRLAFDAGGSADREGNLRVLLDKEHIARFCVRGEAVQRFVAEMNIGEGEHDLFLVLESSDAVVELRDLVFAHIEGG